MKITKPTYLIAELSGEVAELVRSMRTRFNPSNVNWPADITVAGSSGVGTLKLGQSLDEVVEKIIPVMTELSFTRVKFTGIERFPETGIYYLMPERLNFDLMHEAIVASGLEFDESPWPYNPHCTLRWQDGTSPEIEELFKSIELPEESIVDCFSLYQPEKIGGNRIYTF